MESDRSPEFKPLAILSVKVGGFENVVEKEQYLLNETKKCNVISEKDQQIKPLAVYHILEQENYQDSQIELFSFEFNSEYYEDFDYDGDLILDICLDKGNSTISEVFVTSYKREHSATALVFTFVYLIGLIFAVFRYRRGDWKLLFFAAVTAILPVIADGVLFEFEYIYYYLGNIEINSWIGVQIFLFVVYATVSILLVRNSVQKKIDEYNNTQDDGDNEIYEPLEFVYKELRVKLIKLLIVTVIGIVIITLFFTF